MSERDSQRSKVYKAERAIDSYATALPQIADIERFVKKAWASKRVQKAWPKATRIYLPEVGDGRGRTSAGGTYNGILMPVWSRNSVIVLHELAHCIVARQYGSKPAGHGWQFAGVFLKLVLYMIGREAYNELKRSFKAHRVRHKPKATRTMTPETREILRQRVAMARAMKGKKDDKV